ncbi:hemicentin-1-like [Bolinopsis microptera]|uniref:hemicentin-1-like n=1 Tax=Bolinopsis microptera TaxID=2820187 RepID=UPI0030795E7A
MILRGTVLLLILSTVQCNSYCSGDMQWEEDAPICISTCPQRFYYQECPSRTISRCVCPRDRPVLKREHETVCVTANSCEEPDWFKLGPAALRNFKFSTEPKNQVITAGRSLTLSCFVSAEKPVQYYWYKMSTLPSGDMTSDDNLYLAGSTSISISNIKVSDAGYYQCKARSQDGYSLLSRVSEVLVKHTSFDSTVTSSDGVVTNKARAILKCNKASASYPPAQIQWTKDGNSISEADVFMNSKVGQGNFGDLYILNVKENHAGVYKCIAIVNDPDVGGTFVLSQITFKIRGSQNQVSASPVALEDASYGDKVKLGEDATLYCGAYGYPPAEYTWAKAASIQQASSITGCGEKTCVEDYGRRLVITNVEESDFGGYFCQVRNSAGLNSLVLTLEEEPKSYEINFKGITPSYTITPNRYDTFNLTCAVDIISTDAVYIGWYKDGKSVSGSNRIYTEDVVTTESRIRKLVFKYPTDGDPGLYQCLAYNSKEFVQASTDVVIKRYEEDSDEVNTELWEPDAPFELKLFKEKKGIQDAHAACQAWKPGAQLVSILDNKQNDRVFRLLQNNTIEKAWIGLTDESKEGKWQWFTLEESTRFSNWKQDEPDNEGKTGSDYAVMDVAKAGKWEDMTNTDSTFPYVCKYYNASCPLLDQDEEFKEYPVAFYTKKAGSIGVFDTATVSCKSGQTVTLVCSPSGKWQFSQPTECEPQAAIGAAGSCAHWSISLIFISYLLAVMR